MSIPQADPLFVERYMKIYQTWQANDISIEQALADLDSLRPEASSNPQHQGGLELIFGFVYGYRSQYEESIAHFETARKIFEKAGILARLATCDLNIGETYRLQGNLIRAQAYFHQAYEVSEKAGIRHNMAIASLNSGHIYMATGNYEKAKTSFLQTLAISQNPYLENENERQFKDRHATLCELQSALCDIYLKEQAQEKAWEAAQAALVAGTICNFPLRLGYANRSIADVLSRFNKTGENPDTYYAEAIRYFEMFGAQNEIAKTYAVQGKSLVQRGDSEGAKRLYRKAIKLYKTLNLHEEVAKLELELF